MLTDGECEARFAHEMGVGLGVDVLHHDLETVEATRLRKLENHSMEVFADNTIGSGEEGEDMRGSFLQS